MMTYDDAEFQSKAWPLLPFDSTCFPFNANFFQSRNMTLRECHETLSSSFGCRDLWRPYQKPHRRFGHHEQPKRAQRCSRAVASSPPGLVPSAAARVRQLWRNPGRAWKSQNLETGSNCTWTLVNTCRTPVTGTS